ncbi:MAG TPA: ABC transporter ATP-binding protein [Candidatus Nitrosotenuis sp.]|nr:ABC transporter ATP-binding protein [Candidatus Nitrosotenuis sp.]
MLEVTDLRKEYASPNGALRVLDGVSLRLAPGESASIMGPSGCGKSSLLYILGALERPTAGRVTLDDTDPFSLDETEAAAFRNKHIGFVFQDHCLLPQLSVLENVLTPTIVGPQADAGAHARELLEQVGLGARLEHRPGELSGGEKQRVAIARALVMRPSLVLCDEPTGNLDGASAGVVADLLLTLHAQQKTILVIVTHNPELAARCTARYELRDRTLHKL